MICSISKSLLSWMTSIVFLGVNVTVHHSTFFGCFIWKGFINDLFNQQKCCWVEWLPLSFWGLMWLFIIQLFSAVLSEKVWCSQQPTIKGQRSQWHPWQPYFHPSPPCWRAASNSYPNFKSTQDMSQKRKTLWIRSLFSVQCCCSFWCRVFLYPWQYSNL